MSVIGLQFAPHRFVGLAGVLAGSVHQMQQYTAALDMAEKAITEAGAFMRAFDQTRNVRQHEFTAVDVNDPELWMKRSERIIRDLRLGGTDGRQEGRFSCIG